ncbi:MAG: hypothetical protein ACRDBO_05065 [Lachnospiraceae bacterium]
MFESVARNPQRQQFFYDANRKAGLELFEQYFPETSKVKLKRTARIICYKTGIYSIAKRAVKAIIKK